MKHCSFVPYQHSPLLECLVGCCFNSLISSKLSKIYSFKLAPKSTQEPSETWYWILRLVLRSTHQTTRNSWSLALGQISDNLLLPPSGVQLAIIAVNNLTGDQLLDCILETVGEKCVLSNYLRIQSLLSDNFDDRCWCRYDRQDVLVQCPVETRIRTLLLAGSKSPWCVEPCDVFRVERVALQCPAGLKLRPCWNFERWLGQSGQTGICWAVHLLWWLKQWSRCSEHWVMDCRTQIVF